MQYKTLTIPEGYRPSLGVLDTADAIKLIKDDFERRLAETLKLTRVSAPLFVLPRSGLNDDLTGVERPVQFDLLDLGEDVQIVHSLAKWKRLALARYGVDAGHGLYTDMNAIRRDETLDNLHSIYVDQWDWELVITREQRTEEFLKATVVKIARALVDTQRKLIESYPHIKPALTEEVMFISSQELEDMYPNLTPDERECKICKEHGTVFVFQIGDQLKSGKTHGTRAPDYDDWSLNGDLIVWNPILGRAFELSSMGIRVDAPTLERQLDAVKCNHRRELMYHKALLSGELPLTIGGGLGQSRICMLLLGKAHIGEVQASVWPEWMIQACEENHIYLL